MDDTLFLVEINEFEEDKPTLGIHSIFPEMKQVAADWYSGTLVIGHRNKLPNPYYVLYERPLEMDVKSGQINGTPRIIKNSYSPPPGWPE